MQVTVGTAQSVPRAEIDPPTCLPRTYSGKWLPRPNPWVRPFPITASFARSEEGAWVSFTRRKTKARPACRFEIPEELANEVKGQRAVLLPPSRILLPDAGSTPILFRSGPILVWTALRSTLYRFAAPDGTAKARMNALILRRTGSSG